MTLELYVSSQGRLRVESRPRDTSEAAVSGALAKIERAFLDGEGAGLLHLATADLKEALAPSLVFARTLAQRWASLSRLKRLKGHRLA